jgi:hypothetical protein
MSLEEQKNINNLLPEISDIINDFCYLTIDELMQKYNRNNHE